MKTRLFCLFSVLAALMLLNGCKSLPSVGPDYEQPESEVPDAWHQAVQEDFETGDPDLQTWWSIFEDETMDALITRAATNNLSLKTAVARIEQAAALRGVSASQWYPEIVADAAVSAIQTSERLTAPGTDRRGELYQAGLGMAWELDVWGRVRRSVESADASLQATVENYRDILVVLYADIAVNYINVRTVQERIMFAENNLKAQTETLELTRNRFDSGLVPALDVSQAELNRARTESVLPQLRQSLIEAINRLSVLTGDMPYALLKELEQAGPTPAAKGEIIVGLPAELLRQRPDIREAERNLAAQNALIGATKAELYPTLTLPGTLSLASPTGGDLFSSGNVAYSFGPQLRWSIFNGRRIRSQIDAEKAATKAALHTYEQIILLALEETEDAMASYANEKDRFTMLMEAEAAARRSVELVTELYKSGLTDFQNVLNTERALLEQQDQLATSKGLISANLVAIYKALGGGWNTDAEQGE